MDSATAQFSVDDGNAHYTLNYNLTLWLIPCFAVTIRFSAYFHVSDLVNFTYCLNHPIWLLADSLQTVIFLQFKNMVTYTMQYWRQHCCCHRSHTWRIKIHENLFVKCHGLSSWQNNRFWVPYTLQILSGNVFLSLSPSGDSNVHYKSRV